MLTAASYGSRPLRPVVLKHIRTNAGGYQVSHRSGLGKIDTYNDQGSSSQQDIFGFRTAIAPFK